MYAGLTSQAAPSASVLQSSVVVSEGAVETGKDLTDGFYEVLAQEKKYLIDKLYFGIEGEVDIQAL